MSVNLNCNSPKSTSFGRPHTITTLEKGNPKKRFISPSIGAAVGTAVGAGISLACLEKQKKMSSFSKGIIQGLITAPCAVVGTCLGLMRNKEKRQEIVNPSSIKII